MNVTFSEIFDKQLWNDFLVKTNSWSFFQDFTWGGLQTTLHHQVSRLGIYQDEELIGLCQIIKVAAKRGTYLHVRQGPVVDGKASLSLPFWKSFSEVIREIAKKEKAWFVRINPMLTETEELLSIFKNCGFQLAATPALDAEKCWVLPLTKTEEELLFGMRKTTRYLVRQAEKLGVQVTESDDIDSFMKLYTETSHRHGFIEHKGVKEEFEFFKKENRAALLLASHEGTLLSGALLIYFGNQAIYHHGASLSNKIPASYLLQWEAIKRAKKRGAEIYNFWGVAPENASETHPWNGITLFKKGFGGEYRTFIHAHDLPLSPLYRLTRSVESMEKKKKGF